MTASKRRASNQGSEANLALATEFLLTVLPVLEPGEVYRTEGWPTPVPFADNFLNVLALAKHLIRHGQTSNVYFTPVAFQSAGKGRKAEAVARVRVVWTDLDCGPGKPFMTREDALECIGRFLLKPRFIVSSGRGLHVYWLLDEEIDADGLPEFMAIVLGLADKLGGDLKACLRTQLMRVPGTMNLDSAQKKKDGQDYPVELLEDNPDAPKYSLSDFEDAGVLPYPETVHAKWASAADGDFPEADFTRVVEACGWIQHCQDDAATLPESEWYAMLSIVGRCGDGESLAHELSKPHPKYDPRETDAKLAHALNDAGPRTCANIEADQGGRPYCETCPLRGRIKSPIVAGHPDRDNSESAAEGANGSPMQVPPYPVEALPEPVRRYVNEGTSAMGVLPDFIAPHLIASAGGVLGRNVRITIKPVSWIEYPTLWSSLVALPGTAKSPALSAAMKGVSSLQKRANAAFNDLYDEYEQDFEVWSASKSPTRGAKPVPPTQKHFYTTDATPEALAPMLMTSPGLTITADELLGWVNGMDAYKSGKGKERQSHLQLWAGQEMKIDRKGQRSIVISNPVISVIGAIQPDMLSSLSGDVVRPDGFLDRFLWSYPATTAPSYWTTADISREASDAIEDLFKQLADLKGEFSFDGPAWGLWVEWYDKNADIIKAETGIMAGVASKMARQLARVALVLHCLRFPEGGVNGIDVETLTAAISIIEYHREHARKALSSLKGADSGGKATSLRDRILKLLGQGVSSVSSVSSHAGAEGTISRGPLSMDWWPRSLLFKELGGRVTAEDLDTALDGLEADGMLERKTVQPIGPRGGRPSEQFRLVTVRRN